MTLRVREEELGVFFRNELPIGFNSLTATRTRRLPLAAPCNQPYLRNALHTMRLMGDT